MDGFIRDVRYGFRLILRAPAISLATTAAFALGIGLNAGVFTIMNGMLFRPRVIADPGSFVHLMAAYSGDARPRQEAGQLTTDDYKALRDRTTTLRGLTAWSVTHARLGPEASDVMPLLVSCSFFDTYGLDRLERGRIFSPDECETAAPVAVIGFEFWQRQFGLDPDVLGKPLLLNRVPFVIVGVTPAGFPGRVRGEGIWIPYANQPALARGASRLADPRAAWLWVEGRLRPGVGREAAQAELNVIVRQQDALAPGRATAIALSNGAMIHEPDLQPVAVFIVPLVLGSAGLVLVIACGNVALLLLSRAVARRREIAVRLAIGCGRARLLRMLLTESLLYAALGVPLSAWIAWEAPAAIRALIPAMPFYPMQPDAAVFSYLAAAALTAGLAAGVTPALESLRQRLAPALGGHDPLSGAGGATRSRDVLIAAQVGTSVVLLTGTALFVGVERTLTTPDPTVDAAHVMIVNYDPPAGAAAIYPQVAARLASLPGVKSVAYARGAGGDAGRPAIVLSVRGTAATAPRRVAINTVSASYFETLNRRIVQGRALQQRDARAGTGRLVISEPLARDWWPRGGAIGALLETPERQLYEVVGVVRGDLPLPGGSFDPIQAYTLAAADPPGGLLLLRFEGDPAALQGPVRAALQNLGPASWSQPATLAAADAAMARKFLPLVDMVGTLGVTAIALALIGIYGVVSFAVGRRTREIGVRMALGATRADILRLVVSSGARPIAVGIAGGFVLVIPGAIALARVFQQTPVPLHPGDPVPYAVVALGLALAALVTMLVPARRAAAVDPSLSLRSE